ncbi:uncharacterized protein LOC143542847 [Bidens hawaiensis]|uniref:uncharacterized protein LOC143542847 n=1 Tax=Bidens hawaiensis TaxID=980011 RepID=UPI00404B51DD
MNGDMSNDLNNLTTSLQAYHFKAGADKWLWLGDKSDSFSVASVKKLLNQVGHAPEENIYSWNYWLPLKLNTFGWRVNLARLPTMDALIKRKIINGPNACCFCWSDAETVDHLFTGCFVASLVWQKISKWCKIPPIFAFTIGDLFNVHKHIPGHFNKKRIVQSSFWLATGAYGEPVTDSFSQISL